MPLFVQSKSIELNQTANFEFPGAVLPGYYVVGGSLFELRYSGNDEHDIREISMSLAHGQADERTIYVTVNGAMYDDSGHVADPRSRCQVVVIAWVGSSDTPTVAMQNLTGVSPASSPVVRMPPNGVLVYTFLSGLQVKLPTDHGLRSYSASSTANVDSIDGRITVTGGSALNGTAGTVDVGLLILTDAKAPFQMFTESPPDGNSIPINFKPAIGAAVTPLISFTAAWDGGPVNAITACFIGAEDAKFPTSSIEARGLVYIATTNGGTWNGNSVNALVLGVNSGA